MKLNVKNVAMILKDCFAENMEELKPEEIIDLELVVIHSFCFKKNKIEQNCEDIKELLKQLPEQFWKDGGWSFLKVPFDKNDNQWGEQRDAEMLMALGMAAGYVKHLLQKEFWFALPGGGPYFVISF